MYFGYPTTDVTKIISDASNIKTDENPSYSVTDFLSVYPQFGTDTRGNVIINTTIIQMYIDLADACVKQARWRSSWKIATSLFVAHWCTLYLRNSATADDGKDAIIQNSGVQGIITTETVDGVSYSMDINTAMEDLKGYGSWKTTDFGVQFATLAKVYGKGMMLIW